MALLPENNWERKAQTPPPPAPPPRVRTRASVVSALADVVPSGTPPPPFTNLTEFRNWIGSVRNAECLWFC